MKSVWNAIETSNRCVHQLFEAQAEQTAQAAAVTFEGTTLTYAQLNARANALARYLQKRGVQPETLVAVCMERSLDLVVAILAVMKAGGAFVPLDPSYPQERLALILEDTSAPVLLTQSAFLPLLPAHAAQTVCTDREHDEIEREAGANLNGLSAPEQLVYLIYTSGSTGRPKAVMVEHRNLTATLLASREHFRFGAGDVIPWIASAAFDIAYFELLNPLLTGGTSIVLKKEQVLDLPFLLEALQSFTMIHTVPSLMRQIVHALKAHDCDLAAYDNLRKIFIGGDAVPPDLLLEMHDTFRQAQIHILYGPTEGTIICAQHPVPRGERFDRYLIGTAMHHADLRIVDETGAVTEEGELYIGGLGVTRGYCNRQDLTEEKYIQHDGKRWYKSGDLVRRLPDGTMEFLGRIDNQVKIRGFRIELGEIEAALGAHPELNEAVVIAREEESGDKRLAAYVVGRAGTEVRAGALRSYLAGRLPEHMMPSFLVVLDALPLNPNGKVDRKALPAPAPDQGVDEYDAPQTATELLLAKAFGEVLGYKQVGRHASFFELGGHSLHALKIIAILRAAHRPELSLNQLFQTPTIAELGDLLDRTSGGEAALPALLPVPREGQLTLSFSQERVWFLRQLSPTNHSYSFQVGFRFRGALNIAALERTLSDIIERHEIFRTTFPAQNGRPYQIVHEPFEVNLPLVDLTHLPETEREAELMRFTNTEIRRAFDMTQLPLVRWTLFRLHEQEHVLLHVEDHLVHDGWSFTVFVRELVELYNWHEAGRTPDLPKLTIQFADYADWQKRWMKSAEAAQQLDYWSAHLQGAPRALELPTDFPRPAVQGFQGKVLRIDLPEELANQVREVSKREGVTLFMTLFAAFNVLLHRYSGQDDLLVGSALANRRLKETEHIMGMLVTNIVLRNKVEADMQFRTLLRQVRETALTGYANQDLPFEKIVERLGLERDLSRNPLFQVSFSFHDSQMPELTLHGLELELIEGLSNGTSKFDMNIICIPRKEQRVPGQEGSGDAGGVTLLWEYDTALFADETIERMVGHYKTLLRSVIADAGQLVALLPMLTAAEQQQLLIDWNDTGSSNPQMSCIHELVTAQAALQADAPAVQSGDVTLTYGELNRLANQLAHRLQSLGVGPETLVGICMERSPELVVSTLAVLKAGGAYVPMDPSYPQERLDFIAADAGLTLILQQDDVRFSDLDKTPAHHPTAAVTPHNLAYVIYTSGSTGTPKGVEVEHRTLVNLALWTKRTYELSPADRSTLLAGTAFDASVWELWSNLIAGACLYLPSAERRFDPKSLMQEMADLDITFCFLPTPLAERVLAERLPEHLKLRVMMTGGDQLHPVQQALPFRLVNHYGPTENTVVTTCAPVVTGAGSDVPPIGKPITGVNVYVLDAHLQPVPVGVPGELYIGGSSLARGYRNRPDLTADRFQSTQYGRLYRSGDLVRWLSDGNLEFLGRLDQQVKVRGFRIELGEIEAVLVQHDDVQEAVVTVFEHEGEKRLSAYLVTRADLPGETLCLPEWLAEKLPDYMVPSDYLYLPELPLTPNGKVDLRALPQPSGKSHPVNVFIAPRTPIEELVAAAFSEVLHVDKIGIDDDFFQLGGHSLLVTQVTARLLDTTGVAIPLRDFFAARTVAKLSKRIEAGRYDRLHEIPPITAAPRIGGQPLSFAQARLLFLDRLMPDSHLYNIPLALRLEGPLHVAALETSINEIVRRHESLRTTFAEVEEGDIQLIASERAIPLSLHDISTIPANEQHAEAERLVRAEGQRSFDLAAGPLLRTSLVRLNEEEHLLMITVHHIVFDGWSMGIFTRELAALYEASVQGIASALPDLPLHTADYAVWQRDWLQGDKLDEQLDYWKKQLGGELPTLNLRTDYPRPAKPTHKGRVLRFLLPAPLMASLKELSGQAGTTLYMTMLAAFQTLLYRYTEQEDIRIGTPVAGRSRPELEDVIGCFVNTLVLRGDLSGNPTFYELLERVRDMALGAFAHSDVPFDKLVEELQPERSATLSPLFQVMFVWQNLPIQMTLPGLTLTQLESHHGVAKFDLTLSMKETDEGLAGYFEYDTDLFTEETIRRMTTHLERLLQGIVENPQQKTAHLPLLTEEEQDTILTVWNNTGIDFPEHLCLHQLFEEQARRTPYHTAAVCKDEVITYDELDARANQLAHRLQALGAGPNVPVGVCMDRSLELVVALVGILKAGSAFVPLDTDAPPARIEQVLRDAKAPVCLTQTEHLPKLPAELCTCLALDAAETLENCPTTLPKTEVTPEHLVSIYYTSGSTGQPKGVCSTHKGWVNRMLWMQRQYQLRPEESVLQKTTLTFDDAACEFFWPLIVGGRIALLEPGLHKDPRAILNAAIRERAAFLTFVPSMLALFVDAVTEEDRIGLKHLRHVGSSGEALRSDLVRAFREKIGCELHNTWGATEVSIDSTIHTCTASDEETAEIVSIGRPIDNNTSYVLDKHLQPVPIGVPGDLYLGGVGLATGYLNDPEKTAAAFVQHPFLPGERIYRTGDRGYYRADGSLMFLGRQDDQIKVRGQRVELAEIEAVLLTHPALQSGAVAAHKRPTGYFLAAYYVLRQSVDVTLEDLRAYMAERLPEYMVPLRFLPLEEIPVTVSGKVDRKQLPDPGEERPELLAALVEPRTKYEACIAAIWQEVLELNQIGVYDHFFDLGGHSLTATRIVSRINRELALKMPLSLLFESPTIADLARFAEEMSNSETAAQGESDATISQLPKRAEGYELSQAQKRFLFQYQYDPTNALGVVNALRLTGLLDCDAFLRAYHNLVSRHGIMRTTLADRGDGHPVQIVHDEIAEPITLVDLSHLTAEESARRLFDILLEERTKPFDLSQDTFFRAKVYRVNDREHVLLFAYHPIAFDGWSNGLLMKDLSALYQACTGGTVQEVPPALQYVDYAAWQNQQLESGALDEQKRYWHAQLAKDIAPPQLPVDEIDTDAVPAQSVHLYTMEPELTDQIKQFAAKQGTTLYLTLLAAFNIWLSLASGQEEITIGSPLSGRSKLELEPVLGLMVNAAAIRTDLTGNPSGLQVLEAVKQTALEAYANQDYPFDLLLQELRPRRGGEAPTPFYTIVFVGQNAHTETLELDAGLQMSRISLKDLMVDCAERMNRPTAWAEAQFAEQEYAEDPTVSFDLHLDVYEEGERLSIRTLFDPKRYLPETVGNFLSQYETVLQQFVKQPERRLIQFELPLADELEFLF